MKIPWVSIKGLDNSDELGFEPQPMVRWLSPRGLSTTALQVGLSGVFGAYSDKREIQAALKPPGVTDLSGSDELWFDWIADVGDGFSSTYATAKLLAQPTLSLPHEGRAIETKRGRALVLGGDLAYPAASLTEYQNRFVGPYSAAFPEAAIGEGEQAPLMIACAGNHDWYDGLTTFLRLFCTGRRIGGWQTEQPRSYFLIKLPHNWWMMGIDLAFDYFIDQPQMDFFRDAAKEVLAPGDKVILATHKPSWIFGGLNADRLLYSPEAMSNLQRFEIDVIQANGLKMPLALAGDIHHYNRYEREDGSQHRITSGSGSAFLYPTHNLPEAFAWPEAGGAVRYENKQVYPSAAISKKRRKGILLAPLKNPSFMVFIAIVYVLYALMIHFAITQGLEPGFKRTMADATVVDVLRLVVNNPASFLMTAIFVFFLIVFADASRWWKRIAVGGVHAWFQLSTMIGVIIGVTSSIRSLSVVPFTILFVLLVAFWGALWGSAVFAVYLWIMQRFFKKHPTHSFSAQRIEDFRSFLRLKVERDGALTIYPLAVKKVPQKWRFVKDRAAADPWFEPEDRPIEAELIEPPIRIEG